MAAEKRFSFSREKSERDKRTRIHEAIDALQREYPEILGMSLFGSLTKGGKGGLAKDIDGYVYLDADIVAKKENVKVDEVISYENSNKGKFLRGEVWNPVFAEAIAKKYEDAIRQELLRNNLELESRQVEHIWVFPVNEAIIIDLVDGYAAGKYEAGDMLRGLFHMRIGGYGIQKYRKAILDELNALGRRGEDVWQRLIRAVAVFEQDTRVPETEARVQQRHYPQTIQDARRVYG